MSLPQDDSPGSSNDPAPVVSQRQEAAPPAAQLRAFLDGFREVARRTLPPGWHVVPFGSQVQGTSLTDAALDIALVCASPPGAADGRPRLTDADALNTFVASLTFLTHHFVRLPTTIAAADAAVPNSNLSVSTAESAADASAGSSSLLGSSDDADASSQAQSAAAESVTLLAGDFSNGQWCPKQTIVVRAGGPSTGLIDMLLAMCINVDPRAKAFIKLVKYWAQSWNLLGASGTFPWTLLATFYLQLHGFLPPLKATCAVMCGNSGCNVSSRSLAGVDPSALHQDFVDHMLTFVGRAESRETMCLWTGSYVSSDAATEAAIDIATSFATAAVNRFVGVEQLGADAAAMAANIASFATRVLVHVDLIADEGLQLFSFVHMHAKTSAVLEEDEDAAVEADRDAVAGKTSLDPARVGGSLASAAASDEKTPPSRSFKRVLLSPIREDRDESELDEVVVPSMPSFGVDEKKSLVRQLQFRATSEQQAAAAPLAFASDWYWPHEEIDVNDQAEWFPQMFAGWELDSTAPWYPWTFWMSPWTQLAYATFSSTSAASRSLPSAVGADNYSTRKYPTWTISETWEARRVGPYDAVVTIQLDPSLAANLDRVGWENRFNRRDHQIALAKMTRNYNNWKRHFKRHGRREGDPATPRVAEQNSKREFEKLYQEWRHQLHSPVDER